MIEFMAKIRRLKINLHIESIKLMLNSCTDNSVRFAITLFKHSFFHSHTRAQVFNNFSYTLQNKHDNSSCHDNQPIISTYYQSFSVPRKRKFLKSNRLMKNTSSMFKHKAKAEEDDEKPNTIVLTRFGAIFHFYLSEEWPKRLDVLSRVVFPATFLVFNLAYWIHHVGQQHWRLI